MNNPHYCAKTTFHSREVMIHRVLVDKHPVNRVANDFAISIQTVYKWLGRYTSGGTSAEHLHCTIFLAGQFQAHLSSLRPWLNASKNSI